MSTKGDVIDSAYSLIRISGVTLIPDGDEVSIALNRLEGIMDELSEFYSVVIGYNFTADPDPADDTGVRPAFDHMMASNLAVRLVADFGKSAPMELQAQASATMSAAIGWSASRRIKQVQYPSRMPTGSGNRIFGADKFYSPQAVAPTNANWIYIGNIQDYTEDFNNILSSAEDIASYTITADSRLSVISDSELNGVVSYRVEAIDSVEPTFQQIRIDIETTEGREISRLISFQINDPETVGGE